MDGLVEREKGLGRIRGASASGYLCWSKAELLSRHATAETEVQLLTEAVGSIVRALKMRLEGLDPEQEDAAQEKVSKTVLVNETEVAMIMASRMMVSYLVGRRVGDEAFVEALLAEAETSLQGLQDGKRGSRSIYRVDLSALEAALAAMAPRPRTRASSAPSSPVRSAARPGCSWRRCSVGVRTTSWPRRGWSGRADGRSHDCGRRCGR